MTGRHSHCGGDGGTLSIVAAQDVERRRIARDLHDGVAQTLTALRLELGLFAADVPSEDGPRLAPAIRLVDQALDDIRAVANDLRPSAIDDLGLPMAIRGLVTRAARSGQQAEVVFRGSFRDVSPECAIGCYRIVQEAVANAVKHSGAPWILVKLARRGPWIEIDVCDDGRGFQPEAAMAIARRERHFGLLGMSERVAALNGTLSIASRPGGPTRIEARVSLGGLDHPESRTRLAPRAPRPMGRRAPRRVVASRPSSDRRTLVTAPDPQRDPRDDR